MSIRKIVKIGLADVRDGRLLVLLKRDGHTYILPGGKPEAGETEIEALQRELVEELGCGAGPLRFEGAFVAPAADMDGVEVTVMLYSGRLTDIPMIAAEIVRMAWVPIHGDPGLPLAPSIVNLIIPHLRRDPALIEAATCTADVSYLPKPNRVELVLTDVTPPLDLTTTSFVYGVTDDDGTVLTNNRRREAELVGGHIEPGESPAIAGRREGGEEIGAVYGMIHPIGFLRMISEGVAPDDWGYPHPISYQALHAAAIQRLEPYVENDECLAPIVLSGDDMAELPGLDEPLRIRIRLLHTAAMKALGRDMTIAELAADARPKGDADWGTQRQVYAQNRFFDECRRRRPDLFGEESDFEVWCLKATSDEMIDEALRLLGEPQT